MRALSVHPMTTEILFAIGAGDQLVGRTDACDAPPQALKVPSIGPPDEVAEVLVEVFEPEIVLTGPGQGMLAEELEGKRRIVRFDPQDLDEMYAGIRGIAETLGKQVEADIVIHDIRILLDHARGKSGRFSPVRVYCETSHSPAASNGYVAEIITAAGGMPFTGPATPERLQEFDPQIIISCVPGEESFNFDLLTARDGWQGLSAVRYERLFSIPGGLLHRPGPRLKDGIREVAKLLHGVSL